MTASARSLRPLSQHKHGHGSMERFEVGALVDYTDEALLAEIRRVADLVGEAGPFTVAAFSASSRVSATTVRRGFGTWEGALSRAGLAHRYGGQPVSGKMRRQSARSMSDAEILDRLRAMADREPDGLLTVVAMQGDDLISPAVVRSRFGSWAAGLLAAGLALSPSAKRHTDEECFENLLAVWAHYGRAPMYREMSQPPSAISGKAYVIRFRTWRAALWAFAERANAPDVLPDGREAEVPPPWPTTARPAAPPPEPKVVGGRTLPLALRFAVLRRDRFRCVACGGSPALNAGCTLHVDHIVPYSRGGGAGMDNLRALCADCNVGRSNKYMD